MSFAVVLTLLLTLCPVLAETRVALVIGIDAYQNAPHLTNPVNDAQAIGDALRRLDFEVQELHDPDFRALTRGLRDFGIRAQGADTALVYYAGHGVQVDRENYLIPTDAKLERQRDLAYEALPLSLMLDEVAQASKIGLVLLDSCRNNPFLDRVSRSMTVAGRAVTTTPGLARVDNVPRNTMVVMAAKADQIAEDGQDHSPFATAILAHLQIPGLELGLFFRSVRDAVLRATQNRQEPYVFSSLGAEPFYFYPRPPNRLPVIGPLAELQVRDGAGPTLLGIPAPTDPDLDPLTVRIIGLPRGGEVRVAGRPAVLGEAYSVDHFKTATFKPDGTLIGSAGTLDLLVEDGRGGSATGSLPIVVQSSSASLADQPSASPTAAVARPPMIPAPARPPPGEFGTSAALAFASQPPGGAGQITLAGARTLAMGVPCALIDVREGASVGQGDRLVVSGPALPGAALDTFLRQLGLPGRTLAVATEPLDPGHCAALAVMTDLLRRSRDGGPARLIAPTTPVPVGSQMMISAPAIPNGAVYVDLYAADGSVQHLRRGAVTASQPQVEVSASVTGAPGQRLLVAITTPVPLNLTQRPTSETETAYLPALQQELAHVPLGGIEPRAELATVSVIPASRPPAITTAATASARAPNPGNPRCSDIVQRVQLGEILSDADRTLLRTSCGH